MIILRGNNNQNCCGIVDELDLTPRWSEFLYFFSRNCIVALLKMLSTVFEKHFLTRESMKLYF